MRIYLCIDLKTFYASVECVERGLDPFSTNLIVADPSRGKGSICLAISPKMKMQGIKNRCRVYEIPKNITYITAMPRMKKYIEYSANIYAIYLKYVAKEDIHVYSIDEAFLDITHYLKMYKLDAKDLAKKILKDIFDTYGLTATAGIGTNLFLCKIALDILAKKSKDNIAYLDEETYKKTMWHYRPLTDFWQIGTGIEKRLNKLRIFDMYDLAHSDEKRIYKEFGINAELLIDHAWGREDCTMSDIKLYETKSHSISNSQILFRDYSYLEARTVLKEMVEVGSLRLIASNLITDTIHLYIGYSRTENQEGVSISNKIKFSTNTYKELLEEFLKIYDTKVNQNIKIRKIGIAFCNVIHPENVQLSLFVNEEKEKKEKNLELAINEVKLKMGKNAIVRGMSLTKEATGIARNNMIGGHNSG